MFYAYCNEGLLENYMTPWRKMVSTSQKISFHLEILDGKKLTGVSKNGEKKWFSLAGKPVSPTMNKLPLAGIFF